jgi:CRISPR/Cas system Type II protein with McrA/HNH and RuvC-like nuclease domain
LGKEGGDRGEERTFDKKLASSTRRRITRRRGRGSKIPQWSSNLSSSAALGTSTSIPVTQALSQTNEVEGIF